MSRFSGFKHNSTEYTSGVDCPVLNMNSDLDDRVTREQVVAVFDRIQGRKELLFFPETGHESCVNGNAQLWERTIPDFTQSSRQK